LTVIFDAGPLITACKFMVQGKLVVDYLLPKCQIMIPSAVEEEVAILGASYSDGIAAGERIAKGEIQVVPVMERRWARHLASYALGKGELDSIELCKNAEAEALVTDDNLAFIVATRLGLKACMLPDLVAELAKRRELEIKIAKNIMEVIRPRYRIGVIEHNIVRLQEVKEKC
jgi:predicted nucleic acid-binding protein